MKQPTKNSKRRPASIIRSLSLTPDTLDVLDELSQDASDLLGWTISGSAIVRALLRRARAHGREDLFDFIEAEIAEGTVWGKRA